jgi:hypothetical protein
MKRFISQPKAEMLTMKESGSTLNVLGNSG